MGEVNESPRIRMNKILYDMRKNHKISIELEQAIVEVIESLRYYEAEFRSVKRCPLSTDLERIHTLRQYIECRLNFELYSVPELREYAPFFDGHLFNVLSISGVDEKKRRFQTFEAALNFGCPEYGGEDIEEDMERILERLGGSRILVTYSRRKPRIIIEK